MKQRFFLLNADSSQPIDEDSYRNIFNKNLAAVVEKANKEKDKILYIVIDSTCDLLALEDFHIPENVTLIKTYSATKHQRGGRNYFYGGVAVFGSEHLVKDIENEVITDEADVRGLSALHYPRLRKTEVRESTEKISLLNNIFKNQLMHSQSTVPSAFQIKVDSFNYYSFLEFPETMRGSESKDAEMDDFMKSLNSLQVKEELGYESGDSFGLDNTRLIGINGFSFGCLRYSFGSKSNQNEVKRIAEYIGSQWTSLLRGRYPDGYCTDLEKVELTSYCKKVLSECEFLVQAVKSNPSDQTSIDRLNKIIVSLPGFYFSITRLCPSLNKYALPEVLSCLEVSRTKSNKSLNDTLYFSLKGIKNIVNQSLTIEGIKIE